MRVIFDVNVLTRIALGSELAARILRGALEHGDAVLVCEELLAELAETLSKPRLAIRLSADGARQVSGPAPASRRA